MTTRYTGPDMEWINKEAYSDANIENQKQLFKKTKRRSGWLSLFVFVSVVASLVSRDTLLGMSYKSEAFIILGLLGMAGLLVAAFTFMYYVTSAVNLEYIEPIAGQPECAELMYWAERDDTIANRIERIKNQGRQAYLFDYENAKEYLGRKKLNFSDAEIDLACKRLHGVN